MTAANYDPAVYQEIFDCFSELAVDYAREEAEFAELPFDEVYDFNESFDEYVAMHPQSSIAVDLAARLADQPD